MEPAAEWMMVSSQPGRTGIAEFFIYVQNLVALHDTFLVLLSSFELLQ